MGFKKAIFKYGNEKSHFMRNGITHQMKFIFFSNMETGNRYQSLLHEKEDNKIFDIEHVQDHDYYNYPVGNRYHVNLRYHYVPYFYFPNSRSLVYTQFSFHSELLSLKVRPRLIKYERTISLEKFQSLDSGEDNVTENTCILKESPFFIVGGDVEQIVIEAVKIRQRKRKQTMDSSMSYFYT